MSDYTLGDFGVTGHVPPENRCIAFDANGDQCPNFTRDDYCASCEPEDAAFTTEDLTTTFDEPRHGAVRDLLRDGYEFPAKDAVVFATCCAAAIDAAYVLEGRLTKLNTEPGSESVSLVGVEYTRDDLRELHERFRSNVTSATVHEKWEGACKLVERGRRCAHSRKTATACGWHTRRGEDEVLESVDDALSVTGPKLVSEV